MKRALHCLLNFVSDEHIPKKTNVIGIERECRRDNVASDAQFYRPQTTALDKPSHLEGKKRQR